MGGHHELFLWSNVDYVLGLVPDLHPTGMMSVGDPAIVIATQRAAVLLGTVVGGAVIVGWTRCLSDLERALL